MQIVGSLSFCIFFFFNDTATTEIYTLSLHDALPIYIVGLSANRSFAFCIAGARASGVAFGLGRCLYGRASQARRDRKSTRLNSSHSQISYAVFCLKKKNPATKSSACSMIASTLPDSG